MKSIQQRINLFLSTVDTTQKLFAATVFILGLVSVVSQFVISSNPIAVFIRDNLIWVWVILLTLMAFIILYRVTNLTRKLVGGYEVNIQGDPSQNWEFQGPSPWHTTAEGELVITGSHDGGITKVGHQWENYDLVFKARIIHNCLGVIVRAANLNNYYMLQIHKDSVVPHHKRLIRLNETKVEQQNDKTVLITPGQYGVAWEVQSAISYSPAIDGWFDGRIAVRGDALALYINNNLVYEQRGYLQIPTGKAGFRNDGPEKALVKDIKIKLHNSY
jgi:hypothetical protein